MVQHLRFVSPQDTAQLGLAANLQNVEKLTIYRLRVERNLGK